MPISRKGSDQQTQKDRAMTQSAERRRRAREILRTYSCGTESNLDAMLAYADECVREEQARCAKVCRDCYHGTFASMRHYEECAAAIEKLGDE